METNDLSELFDNDAIKNMDAAAVAQRMHSVLHSLVQDAVSDRGRQKSADALRAALEPMPADLRSMAWIYIDQELQTEENTMLRLEILRSLVDLLPPKQNETAIRKLMSEVKNEKFAAHYLADLTDVCSGRLREQVVADAEAASIRLTAGQRAESLMKLAQKVTGKAHDRLEKKAREAASTVEPFTTFANELLTAEIERLAWGGLWQEAWRLFRNATHDLFARSYYSLLIVKYAEGSERLACLKTIIADLDDLPDNGRIWIGIRIIRRLYEFDMHQEMFTRTWKLIDRQPPGVLRCAMRLAICDELKRADRQPPLEAMLSELWDTADDPPEKGPIPCRPYTFLAGLKSLPHGNFGGFLEETEILHGSDTIGLDKLAQCAIDLCPELSGKATYIAWCLLLGRASDEIVGDLGRKLIGSEFDNVWKRYEDLRD